MHVAVAHHDRIAPSARAASAVTALFVYACDHDVPRVSIPRAEAHLVVRFGPSVPNGVDVHAFGARQRVHRKVIRGGGRSVTARLRLGAHEAVLGVPASVIAVRIVALEDLWGDAATRRLLDRLARRARQLPLAAAILEGRAIAEPGSAFARTPRLRAQLALDAADKLTRASVERGGRTTRHERAAPPSRLP